MTREEQIKMASEIIANGCSDELESALIQDFPELKESEDERIRNDIIRFLEVEKEDRDAPFFGMAISYLEKQKEKSEKPIIPEEENKVMKAIDGAIRVYGRTQGEWIAGYDMDTLVVHLRKAFAALEKQQEQKPVIFIPKFKEGDKVISTNNEHLTYDILEVGRINELGNPEYKVEIFEDGKPGILDKPHNVHYIECRKMDEWGKLIEQKPNIELIQRSWYMEGYTDRKFGKEPKWLIKTGKNGPKYELNPLYGQPLTEEQKPNDIIREYIANHLNLLYYRQPLTENLKPADDKAFEDWLDDWWKHHKVNNPDSYDKGDEIQMDEREFKNWSRGIRNMYSRQKPAEWSEEDYIAIKDIEMIIRVSGRTEQNKMALLKWLKSLRPQAKQEWSEEDEKMLVGIIERGSAQIPPFEPALRGEQREWLMNRLKSLRPRHHWKPTKEQMEALSEILESCRGKHYASTNGWDAFTDAQSLYNDLKNL